MASKLFGSVAAVNQDNHAKSRQADPDERLKNSVGHAYRQLRQYRVGVRRLNEQYAGPHYGMESSSPDYAAKPEKFLNLMRQALSAHVMLLAANNPQVLVTSHKLELRPFAKVYQIAMNNFLKRIDFQSTLEQWVRDAFFWIGIIRIHMADSGRVVHEGDIYMDPGIPFVSNISLDDFVYDANAKKWTECQFMGDIYRLPVDTIKNSGQYEGKEVRDLQPSGKFSGTEERVQSLSFGWELQDDEVQPMADLMDLWLPRKKVIRTYIVKNRSSDSLQLHGKPIAEIKWKGSELGPYKRMHFDTVSDNVMPLSTAADLFPLDRSINNIFRKNNHKARRRKEVHFFTPSAEDDANRAKRASDGDFVQSNAPNEINTVATGGVDAGLHGFMLNEIDLFDRMSGNLPAILGLGSSADTATGERLINAGANGRMNQLQGYVAKPLAETIKDLGFLIWEDPYLEIPHRVDVEGLEGFSYDASWMPADREGELTDYQLDVDVYSLQGQGPLQRANTINKLLGEIYLPLSGMIMQQGGAIDFARLVNLHADLYNIPRLKEIITFSTTPNVLGEDAGAKKAPTSNRTYERHSSSGDQGGAPDAAEWLAQAGAEQG